MILFMISAEVSSLTKDINLGRTRYLKHALKSLGLVPRPILGRYKGIDEDSFLIETSPESASSVSKALQDLALRFDQECFLALSGSKASLIDRNGNHIGSLTLVQDTLEDSRPDHDHTAIKIGNQYRVLVLK